MTDKEFRKLKRAELLEIIFYLQKEAEDLRRENETLKQSVDELTKTALQSKITLSEESLQQITQAVQTVAEQYVAHNGHQSN